MKLDFKSLAFGYKLEQSTSTPAWETSLGQGKEYKIKESDGRDRNVLVRKMRMGKFNEYIQKDLIELITGINYEYMDL